MLPSLVNKDVYRPIIILQNCLDAMGLLKRGSRLVAGTRQVLIKLIYECDSATELLLVKICVCSVAVSFLGVAKLIHNQ